MTTEPIAPPPHDDDSEWVDDSGDPPPHPATADGSKDHIALVLTLFLGVCLLLVTAAVAWVAVSGEREMSEEGSRLLAVLLGGLLGIVGSYLGFHTKRTKVDET